MIVVGLTGGMGQGKSTVGKILRELADVDYRADLESSHPICEVCNAWLAEWPAIISKHHGEDMLELANRLIAVLPPFIAQYTGKQSSADILRIPASSPVAGNRLLEYLGVWLSLSEEERAVQLPLPMVPTNKGLHRKLLQWVGATTVTMVNKNIWSDVLDKRIKELAGRNYPLVTVGGIRYEADMDMIHRNAGLIVKVIRPGIKNDSDATEKMAGITTDITIQNNGSLEQLHEIVKQLWQDLAAGKKRSEYFAAS